MRPTADTAERHEFTSGGLLGHDSSYGLTNLGELTALGVDVVYACVLRIADGVAGGRWGEWIGTTELSPSRLVRRPAEGMTRREWTWLTTATLALYNVAHLRRVGPSWDDDGSLSLVPLRPGGLVRVEGSWQYTTGAGELVKLRDDEVRTIRRAIFPTLTEDMAGLLKIARDTFAASWAAGAYRTDFWENGGAPQLVLTTDQELARKGTSGEPGYVDQPGEIRTAWMEQRRSTPGAPAVLGKGVKVSELGADLAATGASDAADRLGAAIARYFGMHPSAINVMSMAGGLVYQNTAEHGRDLVRYTLSGYSGAIEDAITEELPGDPGRVLRIDLEHLTLPGMLERFQAWQIATAPGGWLRPSEVRAREGWAPDATIDLPPTGTPAPAMESIA